MKSKILVTIQNLDIIDSLKGLGITNFVYPLNDFCVGIPNTFFIDEITEGYIYINRILDNKGIDKLKELKTKIIENKNIKGIIFDDLGILNVFKDANLELILFLTHYNNNSISIKYYEEYVSSVIVSSDITESELRCIASKCPNISLYVFGPLSLMYSRRKLINNYSEYFQILYENPLKITNDNFTFWVYENEYGTVIYPDKYYDGRSLQDIPAKYYFYNPLNLSNEEVIEVLTNKFAKDRTYRGFLDTKTIYKLKGGD